MIVLFLPMFGFELSFGVVGDGIDTVDAVDAVDAAGGLTLGWSIYGASTWVPILSPLPLLFSAWEAPSLGRRGGGGDVRLA